jgi:hypothetical protein
MLKPALFTVFVLVALSLTAQQSAPPPAQPPQQQPAPAPAAQTAPRDGKVRVFVSDSQSWETAGGWGAANGSGGGHQSGGARPQTAEIIKTFGEKCPELTVTNDKDRANYVVLLDHEGGKGYMSKDNKVAVFTRDGDAIFSHSTATLGNAVKDACAAIKKDQASQQK